jgi:ABC-type glycerol-3-phosphate transport system substrate-binding protein
MGLLEPLSKHDSAEKLTSRYQEGPLNSGKFNGEYYSVPWYMDCCGLYYNADRLKELNLEVPTTWDELSTALDTVLEAGYGGITTYQSAYAFYSFFYQNDCPVIDTSKEMPKVVVDNQAGKEAWNYVCDLVQKGALVESFKEATTWDKVYESFANGEATFLMGGDWCAPGIEGVNPDMNYGIAPMVSGKKQATILGGWTWNININSKNPDLAYDLISYLNSEKGDSILAAEGKISARKEFDYKKALEGKDQLKVFTEEFPYTEARPAIINEKAIDKIITNRILEVQYGKSDSEQSLKDLKKELDENIAENYK